MEHSDNALRLSRWAHVIKKKGVDFFAVFHSLNIETIFLEKKFKKLISMLQIGATKEKIIQNLSGVSFEETSSVIDELRQIGAIVETEQNDQELLDNKRREYLLPAGLETLYLLVTDTCNLRCRYCFINNNMPCEYSHSSMSWETAKEAVDMFFANISRNPSVFDDFVKMIIFYGGEPLLNFPIIKQVVEYVKDEYRDELAQLGNGFRFSIITNGTAVTEKMALFFKEHQDINIGISIDGPKDVHNQMRVMVGGEGSFNKAMDGLKMLKEFGGREDLSLSCTVDKHNIDRLFELVNIGRDNAVSAVNLNPLLDTSERRISHHYMVKVSRRMLEYFVLAREVGIYEDRIMRKVKAFIGKTIHVADCQATGAQIVCSPEGRLGLCHEGIGSKCFFFSQVSRDFRFHDEPLVKDWRRRTPLNLPQCFDCPALGICGGGCAYGAWLRNGSIWSIDDRFCVHSLKTLEWLVWDLFDKL